MEPSGTTEAAVDGLVRLADQQRERARDARAAADRETRLERLCEEMATLVSDRPAASVHAYQRAEKLLAGLQTERAEELGVLREVAQEARERATSRARDIPRLLPELLTTRHVPIDPASRHPHYTFANHLLDLQVDVKRLRATLKSRHGAAQRIPLDVEELVDLIRSEYDRLHGRPFAADSFAERLHGAYERQRTERPEEPVWLRDLAHATTTTGKPHVDEFVVDVGRLVRDHGDTCASLGLKLNATRDPDRGLIVYGLEHGGLVGTIDMEVGT